MHVWCLPHKAQYAQLGSGLPAVHWRMHWGRLRTCAKETNGAWAWSLSGGRYRILSPNGYGLLLLLLLLLLMLLLPLLLLLLRPCGS